MTITLTERERIVFDALASFLAECSGTAPSIIGLYIFDWLAMQPTESASSPRVPGANAPLCGEGVESGPGQLIYSSVTLVEWERLRDPATLHVNLLRGFPATLTPEQRLHLVGSAKIDELRAEGFRAGIEAAANWHMEAAAEWETADISDADRLKARYRELVKIAHPDRGGDPARFNEITDAIRRTREERA